MTTQDTGAAWITPAEPEEAPVLQRRDLYTEWRKKEGAPLVGGVYISDMKEVEVGPWPRKGVKGALCYLDGDNDHDEHIVEIPPGGQTEPERHMYTEAIYIVSGRGSTTVWQGNGPKQTFEWGPGSYVVLPTNASYQFFNGSLSQPARYFSVTDLPEVLRRWASEDFVFNNPYDFKDRFAGEHDYFSAEAKFYKGRIWETNFVPDIRKLPLYEWSSRGGGGTNAHMEMAGGTVESHISRFPPGYYKKAHRHSSRAHLYIVEGEGFVMTQRGDEPVIRCDWKEGSLYLSGAGDGLWMHQHFNVGSTPAAYLKMGVGREYMSRKFAVTRWEAEHATFVSGGEISEEEGGNQREYESEDPEIHRIFEEELRKRGLTCMMKAMSPYCTGEAGLGATKTHFEAGKSWATTRTYTGR